MNGWDVLSTTITLSISSFIALRVARSSREHDDKRDRRRVRQETAHAIAELFEQTHADALNEFALCISMADVAALPDQQRGPAEYVLAPFMEKSIERYGRIGLSLGVIRVKLMMLKAPKAIVELTKYVECFDRASGEASGGRVDKDVIKKTVPHLRALAKRFEESIAEVASSLDGESH